jgi:MoaA/NifB/PqqE/SkfB family radical SAM enzyme
MNIEKNTVEDRPFFCKAPFHALEITPQGETRICCKMPAVPIKNEQGIAFKVNEDKMSHIWNSPWLNNFRQRFINGEKPAECKMCWDDEDAGITSYRKQLSGCEVDITDPTLGLLVLKLSNKCNCACRICSFWLSSLWQTELVKTNRWNDKFNYFVIDNERDKINENNWEEFKQSFTNLKQLLIYGGEPLINFEVLKILNYLADSGLSKNINLGLNTNGTVTSPEIFDLLTKFKEVNLYFSIDDIGERYDYQRWPAKHKSVFRELKELHGIYEPTNVKISWYLTISIFNIFNLSDIMDEFAKLPKFKINFDNIIHDPALLAPYNLPEDIKPALLSILDNVNWNDRNWDNDSNYLVNIKNFVNLYKSPYGRDDYINRLDELLYIDDVKRKQDWRTTFPILYDLLTKQ